VIEPALGVDRACLAFLCEAFQEDEVNGETRSVLRLHPSLAPIKAGIFPLVKKDGLAEIARAIEEDLSQEFAVFYDESGAIGRRYRRQDECGTPFCITVDYDTKEAGTVTIRNRDTLDQERVSKDQLKSWLLERLPR
jgi:glycyl-tRNA synthetase